jgi:hypothetical protein
MAKKSTKMLAPEIEMICKKRNDSLILRELQRDRAIQRKANAKAKEQKVAAQNAKRQARIAAIAAEEAAKIAAKAAKEAAKIAKIEAKLNALKEDKSV